jgi:hypothetical protein
LPNVKFLEMVKKISKDYTVISFGPRGKRFIRCSFVTDCKLNEKAID